MKPIPLLYAAALAWFLGLGYPSTALSGHLWMHHGAACHSCPRCSHVCKLKAQLVDEDIPCFEVEEKVVCIPRVVFPWQKSCKDPCANNGARIRKVCVLKTDSYQCPKCEYTWKAEPIAACSSCAATTTEHAAEPALPAPLALGDSIIDDFGPEPTAAGRVAGQTF